LRGYAQKDPVVEYKKEAYALFETLLGRIDDLIARRIFRVQIATRRQPVTDMVTNKNGQKQEEKKVPSKKGLKKESKEKLGRNDPCWCGSGKKWKKCHYPQLPQ